MANYAVINNNIVENIIVAETKEIAEQVTGKTCIDCTDGWDYNNGIDGGDFIPVVEPVVEETPAE